MKMKTVNIIMILIYFSLLGCGSSDGDGASKSIFAQWTRDDDTFSLDLTGSSFDVPFIINFTYASGELCSCTAIVSGSEAAGAATVSSCSYAGGGSGDPGCSIWENGTAPYTYTKSGAALRLCDSISSCGNYR